MSPQLKELSCRYGFAITITTAITLVRISLSDTLGDRVPFGLHYISVLLTAWLCGAGPACVSLLLGVLASTYFAFEPHHRFDLSDTADVISLALYSLVGVVAIYLIRRGERDQFASIAKAVEFESLSRELAAADQRKDDFLALLAHELRNPLATLVAGIDAIERSDNSPSKRAAVLASMRRQSRQLVVLVNDVLDVSRYLRGGLSLVREPMDLRSVIDEAIEIARPMIDERRHDLRYIRPAAPLPVDADSVRLTQVLVNLLSNASKYTPERGRIHVYCEATDSRVEVHVADNGIGIPLEAQSAVFSLFTQVNSSATRDGQGLGIGLAVVKQLVDLHDGQILIASPGPGRGSRFTVQLPRIEVSRLPDTGESVEDEPVPVAVHEQRSVLVIDDNRDAAETLATLLRLDGHRVEVAFDGHTGIEAAQRIRPEAILLDIGMPGIDGYETARQIRAACLTPSPRLVAVSGWGSESDRERSRKAGIDLHLTKPVQVDQVAAAIAGGASTAGGA